MSKGYLYVFQNPHIAGLVKIGFTYDHPYHHAVSISSGAGVPGFYDQRVWWLIDQPEKAVTGIHAALRAQQVTEGFFKYDLLDQLEMEILRLLGRWGIVIHKTSHIEFMEKFINDPRNKRLHEEEISKWESKLEKTLEALEKRNSKISKNF